MTLGDFERVSNELIIVKEENQELKKQLEEINKMIEKCGFANIEQVMLNYCGLLTQQKEFIKYLEDEITRKNNRWEQLANQKNRNEDALLRLDVKIEEDVVILQKYKEIIGGKSE